MKEDRLLMVGGAGTAVIFRLDAGTKSSFINNESLA
jgi:hypothetical protein